MTLAQPLELVLYHRYGCHLCDEMLHQLQRLGSERAFTFEVVDVDGSDDLLRLYNEKVPVLNGGGEELCHFELDLVALEAYLRSKGH